MSARPTNSRRYRLIGTGAAALVTVAGLVSVAPTADAAPQPRTYTTVLTAPSSGQATPGVATPYAVEVTNTSATVSALDHVVLTVPAGFSVTPGSVSAPRQGWTESLNTAGTELTAATTQPLKYGLRKGEFLTMSFTATDTIACDSSLVTWNPKADGIIVDPFVAQGSAPTVQMQPVADRFVVTSVQDEQVPPLVNSAVATKPFDVAVAFGCGTGMVPAPAPASAGPLTLSVAGSGSAASLTAPPVAIGGLTAATVVASYAVTQPGLQLAMAATSLIAPGPFTVDIVGAGKTVAASPGVGTALNLDGAASANLGNGATGTVALVVQGCTDQGTVTCSDGTEVSLSGSFKGADGKNLYGYGTAAAPTVTPKSTDLLAPASITWVCAGGGCGHPDTEGGNTNYLYNYTCPGNSCSESRAKPFGEREVEEDFAAFPVYVSLKTTTGYTGFVQAPRCVALPTGGSDPNKAALLSATRVGKIETAAAQGLGFCVDVNAITRVGNSFTGALNIPVLFVEDPRVRP